MYLSRASVRLSVGLIDDVYVEKERMIQKKGKGLKKFKKNSVYVGEKKRSKK